MTGDIAGDGSGTAAAPPRRWAQLTYASIDVPGALPSSGGWQIKQASSDLTEQERERLVDRVSSRLKLRDPPPRLPVPEEIAALPRRFTYTALDAAGIYCHSVHAGPDATGRPGNVFSHVLLDREQAAACRGPRAPRPVELWRAPGWLAPYGVAQVQAAAFSDDQPPTPTGMINRERSVEFLFDESAYRFTTLAVLLDAVVVALDGGPAVVLAAASPDEAVDWLALLSFFLPPVLCTRISFSTYERLHDVVGSRPRALVNAVPVADLDEASGSGLQQITVIDARHSPDIEVTGTSECWRNSMGQLVPRSALSHLVLDLCAQGADLLAERMRAVDALGYELDLTALVPPAWTLAVAIAAEPVLRQLWQRAAEVVLEATPADVAFPVGVRESVERLIDQCAGDDAAGAWALVGPRVPGDSVALYTVAFSTYLRRALGESAWLTAQVPAPLPAAFVPAGDAYRSYAAMSAEAVNAALRMADRETGPDLARYWIRLADFVVRLQDVVGNFPDVGTALGRLAREAAPWFCDDGAPSLVERIGDLHPRTVRQVLGPAIDDVIREAPQRPGRRLSPAVAAALARAFPFADGEAEVRSALEPEVLSDGLAGEVLVQLCERDSRIARRWRLPAAALLFTRHHRPGEQYSEEMVRSLLDSIGGGLPWRVPDLGDVAARSAAGTEPGFRAVAREALSVAPLDERAAALATRLLPSPDDSRSATPTQSSHGGDSYLRCVQRLSERWYLGEQGFPIAAAQWRCDAAAAWPQLGQQTARDALAPHVVIAEMLCWLAERTSDPLTAALRAEIVALGETPTTLSLALPTGLPDALAMMARIGTELPRVADILAGVWMRDYLEREQYGDSVLTLPLSGDVAGGGGALDLGRALLRSSVAGREHADVEALGERLAMALRLEKRTRSTILRAWEPVLPAGRNLLSGLRRR